MVITVRQEHNMSLSSMFFTVVNADLTAPFRLATKVCKVVLTNQYVVGAMILAATFIIMTVVTS